MGNRERMGAVGTVLALGLIAVGARLAAQGSPSAEALDYLIQDVCIDSAGKAVSGDPASCPRHRNLRTGERLPFAVTDYDRQARISYGSMSSIPVRSTGGRQMILVTKSLKGRYSPDYAFDFSRARDAFDLIDVSHSRFASIVRTFDGGCFDQILSRDGQYRKMESRAGGWVLFPLSPPPSEWPLRSSARVTTYRTQLTKAGPQCASNHATGLTAWSRPTPLTFETGKVLSAIRSDHFAAENLGQPLNSFERFYFTREYGMSRWESWWTVAHCRRTLGAGSPRCGQSPANGLRSRCSVLRLPDNEVAGIEQHGGQDWVRMDCRDSTRYVALRRPQLPPSPDIARGAGLVDIDYKATTGG